jgi:hypothetical protein
VEWVEYDVTRLGHMTHHTAWTVERAILAAMVTGAYTPPCRLHLLKTILHPHYAGRVGCQDKDCMAGAGCKGNHMALVTLGAAEEAAGPSGAPAPNPAGLWLFDYEKRAVSIVVVHSKNDRRRSNSPLEYTLPRGPLSKLVLAHVKEGHKLLTLEREDSMLRLFVTKQGKEFNDATFCQFWETLMSSTASGMKYFPPSLARTVFVEDYTSEYGVEPDMWDGAAVIMGNSTAQWSASYNPSRKRRIAGRAINGHEAYVTARTGAGALDPDPQN